MAKEKKEVEEREKKAVQELWRYQGEVKTVRMKADEVRLPSNMARRVGDSFSCGFERICRKRNTPRASLRTCRISCRIWRRR
jgi:hypothetical protein